MSKNTGIKYTNNITTISDDMLDGGFFVGWSNSPDASTHLKILRGSHLAYVAIDEKTGKVVGFINAVSDGVLSAYIPLLEVLPDYQNCGIGGELIKRILTDLKNIYMIDIICDKEIAPYYVKHGAMVHGSACIFRNYDAQSGN
ncbi:MAG: GNAT family N-acetyltransferase [Defluviitaleaceae bacterium]|nr:GNAT family N-acetyltransferase [Defluviitaleaceae bacterium]